VGIDYEGCTLLGVFVSEAAARAWIEEESITYGSDRKSKTLGYDDIIVTEHEVKGTI
jgi:hypothetical protein